MSGRRKFDHISPVLRQLHWLPVKERIDFKIAHLKFKAKLTGQPSYISDLLHPYQPVWSLRSSNRNRLEIPFVKTVFASRAFSVAAPQIWNKLPDHIKCSDTISKFGKQLKTFLFGQAYPAAWSHNFFRAYELSPWQNLARQQKFCIVLLLWVYCLGWSYSRWIVGILISIYPCKQELLDCFTTTISRQLTFSDTLLFTKINWTNHHQAQSGIRCLNLLLYKYFHQNLKIRMHVILVCYTFQADIQDKSLTLLLHACLPYLSSLQPPCLQEVGIIYSICIRTAVTISRATIGSFKNSRWNKSSSLC